MASLENFFEIALGPHFPPDMVVGLRRSASAYAPAQSLALTSDGTVWIWQANRSQIVASFAAADGLIEALSATATFSFQAVYDAACEAVPVESLWLRRNPTDLQMIEIACPAYALPATLLPLYAQLDEFDE